MKYLMMVAALFALAPSAALAKNSNASVTFDQHVKVHNDLDKSVRVIVVKENEAGTKAQKADNGKARKIKKGKSANFKFNNLKEKWRKACKKGKKKKCGTKDWTRNFVVQIRKAGDQEFVNGSGASTNFCKFTMYYASNRGWEKLKSRKLSDSNNTCRSVEFSGGDGKTINLRLTNQNLRGEKR